MGRSGGAAWLLLGRHIRWRWFDRPQRRPYLSPPLPPPRCSASAAPREAVTMTSRSPTNRPALDAGAPERQLSAIEDAIVDIREGRMVILVDDEDRENEGDLVVAAEKVTAESIAFMAQHGRGLVCLALDGDMVDRLGLEPMALQNQAPLSTAFTESIDAAVCQGSGASPRDRARTILAAIDGDASRPDFRVPGHVFPLRARKGGVLVRSGQTEGSVDLARLAGLAPAGVICEVVAEDGSMQRLRGLLRFGEQHGIRVVSVADLIEYRVHHEPLVVCESESRLPTAWGEFRIRVFRSLVDDTIHAALTMGAQQPDVPTLVRVHRANLLGDAFGFCISSSRRNLDRALQAIAAEGNGALVYLCVEDHPDALADLLQTYAVRGQGRQWPTAEMRKRPMDFKEFGVGAQILQQLGLGKVRIMTDHPRRLRAVSGFGLEIVGWQSLEPDGDAVDTERSRAS